MALTHRWTGRTDADLIGAVRMHCYASSLTELPKFIASVTDDVRGRDGEFLLVERDGRAVGTATSLHLTMHLRGVPMPCHGVAYVGAIRTERRKAATGSGELGVATTVMHETLKRGRDRGDIVSALMPFRASYYEHFGYGLVERQAQWSIPVGLLPTGDAGNFAPYTTDHFPALVQLRQRIATTGHCDVERPEGEWRRIITRAEAGFLFVDPAGAWVWLNTEFDAGVAVGRIIDWGAVDTDAFVRILRLLGSLKDQYARFILLTQADFPVNRLLRESQVPHRPVAHSTASLTVCTRMQMRILDHKRFLETLPWPTTAKGEAVLSIRESEGHESRLALRVEAGRAEAKATTMSPTFTTHDKTYAGIITGDMPASTALRFGLAEGTPDLLDTLATGPKPYTYDGF